MKIALAQLNPTVGDVAGNLALAREAVQRGRREGVDLVVLPELTLLGYPPRDLLLRANLVDASEEALALLAADCTTTAAVVGSVTRNDSGKGLPLYNSAVLCAAGRIQARRHKCLLPNYDVFDERRYFEPADEVAATPFQPGGGGAARRVGLTVCEDLWNEQASGERLLYPSNPVARLATAGVDLVVTISASPFWLGKQQQRRAIFAEQVRRHGCFLVYTNQVGGNDDLIFDGASVVLDGTGQLVAQARAFQEDFLVVDLDAPRGARVEPYPEGEDALLDALVLGTRDYVRKCGFDDVVLGLSGGIDSAVVAAIAAEAVGSDRVHAVAMPSRHSSDHSLEDARGLAANLGIDFRIIPIEPMHAAAEATLQPHFQDLDSGVTEENLQARIRGQLLMALSNKFEWLLLTTGNKSELAVGYCTLYGDMCGGLAALSDVSKCATYELARRINTRAGREIIPRRTLTKPPSAELRPGQADQDVLPSYDILDGILERYVEQHQDPQTILAAGFDPETVAEVVRRVDLNEYKRRQAAPGLKVTARAFGVGWRMPIAARWTTASGPET